MTDSGDRAYYIAFDTKEMPGLIVATRIQLGKEIVRDQKKTFSINLCEDPLYPALCAYVAANPPRSK